MLLQQCEKKGGAGVSEHSGSLRIVQWSTQHFEVLVFKSLRNGCGEMV